MVANYVNFYKIKEKEVWDIWNKTYDEQHIWGDLNKEEERILQDILKGKDKPSI